MRIDVGKLIREQVPDKNGKLLPQDLTSGSYQLRDLSDKFIGSLYEGKVVYDKTFGHVTYGCAGCCAYSTTQLRFSPLGIPLLSTAANGVDAYDTCSSWWESVDESFYGHWSTASTTIATVNYYATHTGKAVGSTTSYTSGYLLHPTPRTCSNVLRSPQGSDGVVKLDLQGNPYNSIFVGTDPNLSGANSVYATVSPAGGTFTKTSSQSGDTFTDVTSGGPGWVVKTTTQSSNTGDRKLTVTYAVSSQGQVSKSLNVTARQFAYATNSSPASTCTLGYGTTRLYTYTPYTHPDKAAVPGIGLTGTPVTEGFPSGPPPTGTVTGNGSLDGNSQFTDRISYCSSSPLTLSQNVTQTISIEGYQVRQNLLTYSGSGVTLTNQGPTQ